MHCQDNNSISKHCGFCLASTQHVQQPDSAVLFSHARNQEQSQSAHSLPARHSCTAQTATCAAAYMQINSLHDSLLRSWHRTTSLVCCPAPSVLTRSDFARHIRTLLCSYIKDTRQSYHVLVAFILSLIISGFQVRCHAQTQSSTATHSSPLDPSGVTAHSAKIHSQECDLTPFQLLVGAGHTGEVRCRHCGHSRAAADR